MPAMGVAEIEAFLERAFPQATVHGFVLDEITERGCQLSVRTDQRHLRPGGTVQGPVLMALADTGTYLAILGHLGPVAQAVTSSLEMHFLRKAEAGVLVARTRLVKVGRRLVVAQVEIGTPGAAELVALATVTYTLPGAAEVGS